MTHQELFDNLSFPVFASDKNGCILYKNRFAVRYIGTMRKGSCVARHLLGETIPPPKAVAHIKGSDTPYPNALVLKEENETLFLCLPRLQYPDFEKAAEEALRIFGETPSAFFEALSDHYRRTEEHKRIPLRLGAECLQLHPKNAYSENNSYPAIDRIMSELFKKAEGAFGALGYRVHTGILPSFAPNHPAAMDLYDLLFLFSSLLYFMMRLSDDGKIDITLASDPDQKSHLIRFYIHSSRFPEGRHPAIPLFCEASPECAAELIHIEGRRLISDAAYLFSDGIGGLFFEHPIPYLESALNVRSLAFETDCTALFEGLLARIRDMLEESA